jgi:hypothetical protein
VSPGRITWQEKLRRRFGWPKKGVSTRIARLTGFPQRSVHNWLADDVTPQGESAVLAQLARKLRVPRSWLEDGKPGDPPEIPQEFPEDLIEAVDRSAMPDRIKVLIYALGDRDAREWLADAYERLYLPNRRRGTGS